MSRRNWTLYALLIVVALAIPVLFGLIPPTQASLFQSPLRNYLPMVASDLFGSPVPTPATYYHLYLPLVLRAW